MYNIHTCMHTYMHTYIHTYLHTYLHTYIPAYTSAYVHINLLPFSLALFLSGFRCIIWGNRAQNRGHVKILKGFFYTQLQEKNSQKICPNISSYSRFPVLAIFSKLGQNTCLAGMVHRTGITPRCERGSCLHRPKLKSTFHITLMF